ncbi:GD21003 [Drosophila simulans]|uniref:GD21003 n=1 Tax=Drosophila simulans TaxID=7240 RepID=B4R1D9_DROSI|nr:GD21003 [Drosophila simulans]
MDTNRDRGESLTLMQISSPCCPCKCPSKNSWGNGGGGAGRGHGFASMKNGNTFALIKPIYKPASQLPAKLGHHIYTSADMPASLHCSVLQCCSAQAQAREIATQDQKAEQRMEVEVAGMVRMAGSRQQEPMEPRSSPV